jgi:hypothetical protein
MVMRDRLAIDAPFRVSIQQVVYTTSRNSARERLFHQTDNPGLFTDNQPADVLHIRTRNLLPGMRLKHNLFNYLARPKDAGHPPVMRRSHGCAAAERSIAEAAQKNRRLDRRRFVVHWSF